MAFSAVFWGHFRRIELVDFTLHKPQGFVVKALVFHACHPDTPTTEFKTLLKSANRQGRFLFHSFRCYSLNFLSTCFMSSHTSFLPLGLRSR